MGILPVVRVARLRLARETLRRLDDAALARVRGGVESPMFCEIDFKSFHSDAVCPVTAPESVLTP